MTPDELREYSERVFRHQNGVMTRLMMAPPMGDEIGESVRRRVEKAESRMGKACSSLNEVAAARASGREVDMGLENQVRRTVRSCAESTRRLEALLDAHGIGSKTQGTFEP